MSTRWLPVPDSIGTMLNTPKDVVDLSAAIPVVESILADARIGLPSKLGDFPALKQTGQWLSRKVATELGFIVGSATGSYSYNTYVQQLASWIDVRDASGSALVRYGISVRYIVTAEELKVGAKLNSVGGIAASASYETLRASAEFSTLGIPASWVIDQIPTGGAFDLNKYVEFEGALRGVQKVLKANVNEVLKPQILEVRATINEDGANDYEEALAVSWALSCIARGFKLSTAKSDYGRASDAFKATVETIYTHVAQVSPADEPPGRDARQKAEKYLNGLHTEEAW
jgi:hypothetical protein